MSRLRFFGSIVLAAAGPALGAGFGAQVVSYTPGNANPLWVSPAAALGLPDGISGENSAASNYFGFPNVVSPFSPAYQDDEIVQIGEGGQLTLRLSHYATNTASRELGIFTNVGLIDTAYPNGTTGAAAGVFGNGEAEVRVSENGVNWVSLGFVVFNLPQLHYVNAGPYDTAAPVSPQLADYGIPFNGTLASYSGKTYAEILDVLKVGASYSAGGTWLDLSSTGLSQVGYVQLVMPDDFDAQTDLRLSIDAVTVANAAVGAEVPEPAGLIVMLGLLILARRR